MHHVFNEVISVQTGRIIEVAGFSSSVLLVVETVGIQRIHCMHCPCDVKAPMQVCSRLLFLFFVIFTCSTLSCSHAVVNTAVRHEHLSALSCLSNAAPPLCYLKIQANKKKKQQHALVHELHRLSGKSSHSNVCYTLKIVEKK